MNDIEDDILSILNAFLSNDNSIRSKAESLYTELENANPEKMVNCLLSIINSRKNTYESLLSLIKLSRFIEDSATSIDNLFPSSCLKKIQQYYLSLLADESCPLVIRNYILSVIEDFIFITEGNENDWPELIPFFLSYLNDKILQSSSSTNIEFDIKDKNNHVVSTSSDCSNEISNKNPIIKSNDTNNIDNQSFLRAAAISFFTHFLILRPTDDLDSLVYPSLNLNSQNECERAASLKFLLISAYNKISSDANGYYMEKSGNNKMKNLISQLPQVLASLGQKYFASNFSIFWKIFKKNEKVFSIIMSDIIGLLITNFSDPSNDELFKRDSLFFFHRLFNFSKKCKKLIFSDFAETIIKIISTALQNPEIMPDLYEEAKETIYDILNDSCEKEYDDKFDKNTKKVIGDKKSHFYCTNALEIAQRYAEGSNCYVSSFFINFFKGDMFIEKVFQNASSSNHFIRENAFFCLKKRIENETRADIGSFLFNEIKSKIYNNENEDDLKKIVDLFCLWCQNSNKYDVEPFIKKMFDIISDNDSYLLLYCASVICCKCNQSAKYILKKVTNKLILNFSPNEDIKSDEDLNEDFINSFKLSIISNSYQCVDQTVSQENFQKILPLCLNSSSSILIINSTPFLEIMEIIGFNFAPFLSKIIPHLFYLVRKNVENILPVIDCFEKIVSLFSSSNSLEPFLDLILNFALTYGTKDDENEEKIKIDANKEKMLYLMNHTEILQIRLESIILLNLLLQNNWSNKTLYGKCLQFVMTEIPNETSENCLDELFNIVILFIEHENENKYKNGDSVDTNEIVDVVDLKKIDILKYFLSYVPFAVSKAIEKNSESLFASSASIFVLLLKRIPNEATELFFQIQKLIPHYSIYSPPVTPPSSFSSPFSRSSTKSEFQPNVSNDYNNNSNSNQLRCFSLMLWTDFVTFGPPEHTHQYIKTVVDDLKFYSEKENPLKNKNEEHFRKIAIICLYSYYTAFPTDDFQKKKSDLEIETVFNEFYRIANNVNLNSIDIVETATAAFATVLQKYVNEKNFVLRAKQLIHLLDYIQRQTDESDTVYIAIFQLILMCLKNADIRDFFEPLVDSLQSAINKHLISDSTVDDITQSVIEIGDLAPPNLKSAFQI